jgi:hypothetical protein
MRKFKVVITNRGLRGSGRYIGRHKNPAKGIFGNPFSVKSSKFSNECGYETSVVFVLASDKINSSGYQG